MIKFFCEVKVDIIHQIKDKVIFRAHSRDINYMPAKQGDV